MDFHALNEKTQRGYQAFPIQFYAVTETHPRYEMPLHWHKEFELIRVLSGTFHLFLQNTEYVMGEGDVALVSSGALHRGTPDHCTYECIVFDLKMLGRYTGDKVSRKLSAIKNGEVSALGCYSAHSRDFCKIVHKLFDCLRAEASYYEFTVYSLLYELFGTLYRDAVVENVTASPIRSRTADTMRLLLNWIELHFKDPISLKQLADIAGVNEKYLCHLFKVYTDHTPIDYINKLRVEQALREIQENHLSITEAAFESGFNDLSYFSRTVKKYKGHSPSFYKKQ